MRSDQVTLGLTGWVLKTLKDGAHTTSLETCSYHMAACGQWGYFECCWVFFDYELGIRSDLFAFPIANQSDEIVMKK